MPMAIDDLYERFGSDLADLAARLVDRHRAMQCAGFGTTFADIEGELLYLLIREQRPAVVAEISPNAGYSTNYLLAGVTDNGFGLVHSFELLDRIGGRPTEEVIRSNQHTSLDQQRLVVHLGDARDTLSELAEPIDLLMLDSCHDEWFAEWYVAKVLPLVQGTVFVQDIVFVDQLEPSSEASFMWRWLHDHGVDFRIVGEMERALAPQRATLPERRRLRSNAVVFDWPQAPRPAVEARQLAPSPTAAVAEAAVAAASGDVAGTRALLAAAHHELAGAWSRAGRHRDYLEMARISRSIGDRADARHWLELASVVAQEGSRLERAKALAEVTPVAARRGAWRPFLVSAVAGAGDRLYWKGLVDTVRRRAPGGS